MSLATRVAALIAAVGLALPASAAVTVKDAWVRGTVPGQSTTGGYLTLRSSEDAKLVAVATPAAKRAEIHSSEMKGGVMRMRPVASVPLPPGRDVAIQGDLHLMLIDVTHVLGAGDVVPLTLTVEDAHGRRSQVEVRAPVRPLGQ
jgi:copper(I)-binding protein